MPVPALPHLRRTGTSTGTVRQRRGGYRRRCYRDLTPSRLLDGRGCGARGSVVSPARRPGPVGWGGPRCVCVWGATGERCDPHGGTPDVEPGPGGGGGRGTGQPGPSFPQPAGEVGDKDAGCADFGAVGSSSLRSRGELLGRGRGGRPVSPVGREPEPPGAGCVGDKGGHTDTVSSASGGRSQCAVGFTGL